MIIVHIYRTNINRPHRFWDIHSLNLTALHVWVFNSIERKKSY